MRISDELVTRHNSSQTCPHAKKHFIIQLMHTNYKILRLLK